METADWVDDETDICEVDFTCHASDSTTRYHWKMFCVSWDLETCLTRMIASQR